MKTLILPLGLGTIFLLAGCATTPVALSPVGPNPNTPAVQAAAGQLQVFSRMIRASDDQNEGSDGMPIWHQHSAYAIYTTDGKLLERVGNTVGHYEESPQAVALPAGKYLVKAQAWDYSWVTVPVTVEPGRTTRIHLDGKWSPPSDAPKTDVITAPDGNPIGWRQKTA